MWFNARVHVMPYGDFCPMTVDVLTKTMTFLEERHRIIANNIANANTPYFKSKHASLGEFQKALAAAVEDKRECGMSGLRLRSSWSISDGPRGLVVRPVEDRGGEASILRHDENNVNLETEMSAMAENAVFHRTLADLLRKQFSMMQTAIRERVD